MARWNARVEFLLSVIELLFLSLTVEALQGKMCQNSLSSAVGRSLGAKISGGRGRPWGTFFGFYKTRHISIRQCKLHRSTCRRYDTIPACDGQTDGIAVANTALAMRALRRAVTKAQQMLRSATVPEQSGLKSGGGCGALSMGTAGSPSNAMSPG